MDFKQFLEELGPIKVILTDIILFLTFAKCLLWLQEPEHIEWDSCLLPLFLVLQTLQHPCPGLTSLLHCYYSGWKRSSNVEGKDKMGDKGIFLCFHLHRWLIWDRFIPLLSCGKCLKENSNKIKTLFAAVGNNPFSHSVLWGLSGSGCDCAQHITQLAPILLGPHSISVIEVNTKWSGLN